MLPSLCRVLVVTALLVLDVGHTWGQTPSSLTLDDVSRAEAVIGLSFTDAERDSMLDGLNRTLESYTKLRGVPLPNSLAPALVFNPIPSGWKPDVKQRPIHWSKLEKVEVPPDLDSLAYYPISTLAELIRTRRITSEQLTRMYLARLKKYGPKLECVVTLTESLALA